ncbi:hypothetical protein IMZ48_37385 [Candidatus Bathyarchaeota archaeon]|nr:hypothetical protein [Candidatus Bathyarchaeota archaeon]
MDDPFIYPGPEYYPVMMPAQIAPFGLSQRAFREIARSTVTLGHEDTVSTGGTIYASAHFWFRATLEEARITSDGVKAVVDFATGGSAKAAVRDKCGHDILSAGVKLNIKIDDTSLQWSLRLKQTFHRTPMPRWELIINAPAHIDVSPDDIHVDFDGLLSPPLPLDQVDDWVIEQILGSFTPALEVIASLKASIRLIHVQATDDNNRARLFFVDDRFFDGEAAVVLGHLTGFYG